MISRLEGEAGPGAGHEAPDLARISTGNPHLDAILCGGFPRNSINILMGEPGSGKTILAERLIFANAGDRPILYLTTLSEPLEKVVRYLQQFHFYDEELLGVISVGGAATRSDHEKRLLKMVADLTASALVHVRQQPLGLAAEAPVAQHDQPESEADREEELGHDDIRV